MKKILSVLAVMSLLSVPLSAHAKDDFDAAFDNMDKAFEESAQTQEESWDKVSATLEAEWQAQVKQTEADWEKLRQEVEQKWDEFYCSTNKEWVEYDEGKDTRSRVNFEEGEIEVSTLVPVEEGKSKAPAPDQEKQAAAKAEDKIKQQIKEIFSAKNEVKSEILAGQVADSEGKTVTSQNVAQFSPKLEVAKEPVLGKDGQPRIKVSAKIQMLPEHLKIRAAKFQPQVKEYADKYKLNPALMLAVIHTESYFNPLAKSLVPAYGLMQLVPRYGALEAYHHLSNEKKLLPADYLYNPDNNIRLGATYLYLLYDKYFSQVKNLTNRYSLCIAAYNCGPTRLIKKVVNNPNLENMSNDEAVKLIRSVVPEETKDYILKVQKRMALYE